MATVTATFILPSGAAQASADFEVYLREYDVEQAATLTTKKVQTKTTNGSGEFSLSLEKGSYRLTGPTGDMIDFEVPSNTGTFNLVSLAVNLSPTPINTAA